jgi:arsenate reductase (thioredoxin)
MTERAFNVLFLCAGNSARSIMAEAILDRISAGKFRAYSAGSHPKGVANPNTLRLLQDEGYETGAFRSKSWTELAGSGGPEFDFIHGLRRCRRRRVPRVARQADDRALGNSRSCRGKRHA